MKRIYFPATKQHKPGDILLGQLQAAGAGGLTVGDIRKRIAIMDKIEAALQSGDGFCDLEDADAAILRDSLTNGIFGLAHRDILSVVDAVAAAVSSPAPLAAAAE